MTKTAGIMVMRMSFGMMALAISLVMPPNAPALAATRPIRQLPNDVARWSTAWIEVPKGIRKVGREHGALAALTWGPVQGTGNLVRWTVDEVWDTVKPDKKRSDAQRRKAPNGVILRYEF